MKRLLAFALTLLVVLNAPYLQACAIKKVGEGDPEVTQESFMSLETDSDGNLYEGREFHLWVQKWGGDAITKEIKGYELYVGKKKIYTQKGFWLDFHWPYSKWKKHVKKGGVTLKIVYRTVYGKYTEKLELKVVKGAPELCAEHTWVVRDAQKYYDIVPGHPGFHYLASALYSRYCSVCGYSLNHDEQNYTPENSPEILSHTYDEAGRCTANGCGALAAEVAKVSIRPDPTETVARLLETGGQYSMADAAVGDILKKDENFWHEFGEAIYDMTDVGGILEAVFSFFEGKDEQDRLDETMEQIIARDLVRCISASESVDFTELEDALAVAGDAHDYFKMDIPTNSGHYTVSLSPFDDGTNNAMALILGEAKIICHSADEVRKIWFLMQNADRAYAYLDNLESCVSEDSSVHRACESLRERIDNNLFGLDSKNVGDTVVNSAELLAELGLSELVVNSYIAGQTVIHTAEKLGGQAGATLTQDMGATVLSAEIAAVLIGAEIGHLLTPVTGWVEGKEEELLRAYAARNEIRRALENASGGNEMVDAASLYMTSIETCQEIACDYYIFYGYTAGQLIRRLFDRTERVEDSDFRDMRDSMSDRMDAYRAELGLTVPQIGGEAVVAAEEEPAEAGDTDLGAPGN